MASERDISKRVESCSAFEFQLKDTMIAIWSNEYDEDHNKEGIINLSTAHNEAIQDLITEKLNQPDFMTWDSTMLPYNGHRNGSLRLRKALSEFLSYCSGQKAPETLDPEKVYFLTALPICLPDSIKKEKILTDLYIISLFGNYPLDKFPSKLLPGQPQLHPDNYPQTTTPGQVPHTTTPAEITILQGKFPQTTTFLGNRPLGHIPP
ncbi:1-aminocyclopropane-1-carboxylate synthase-like protein 1 [Strongylocentrotus purpuratus]|uniref:Uncharacterized protein n=1 Tax=Strongylocentrotus purpuratus TaxID=7668 RepID=A0A7M7PLM8_STRPU|nr:1-aminocyclopropane-1-carboxylate synthase-like protein 1 [Strongylocentrotus purpuratus]